MEKDIIKKLDLYAAEDDKYKYSDAKVLHGVDTYKLKDFPNIELSQYDKFSGKDLRLTSEWLVIANYDNKAFSKMRVTNELLNSCSREVIMHHLTDLIKEAKHCFHSKK